MTSEKVKMLSGDLYDANYDADLIDRVTRNQLVVTNLR